MEAPPVVRVPFPPVSFQAWLDAQAAAGVPSPKPLQLVVDHSRLQPLDEILASAAATRRRRFSAIGSESIGQPDCDAFLRKMRDADGVAHSLLGQVTTAVEWLGWFGMGLD